MSHGGGGLEATLRVGDTGAAAPRTVIEFSRIRFGLALFLALSLGLAAGGDAGIVISEFLAINETGLLDGDGDREDWIELHNPEVADLEVEGYFLSDDPDNLTRWQFPAGSVVESGGYLIVFASGKSNPPAGEFHAGFKLAGGGEFLALVAPDGRTVIDSHAPAYPQQFRDTSYGRASDGLLKYFTTPTPGAPNLGGISNPQAQVQFAPPSRTLTGATPVELISATPAAAIRYTTDGSDPDGSSPLYAGPLRLDATTEIRARIYLPGEEPGPVNSASYLRLRRDVQSFTSPLPIVVIENFGAGPIPDKRAHNPPAGDGNGIRQVPRQPAFLAIFEPGPDGLTRLDDPPSLTTRMGLRVRGSSSASQPAKKENYSLEAWSAADGDQVKVRPLGLPADNDFILYAPYNYDRALIRNAFVYDLMRQMRHYASRTRFVEVFVNTEGDPLSMNDFAGVFVFMEKIKQARDRVDIDDLSLDGSTGGWLLESNRMDPLPEDGSNILPYNFHTAGPNRVKQGQGGDDIPTGYNTFLNFVEPTGYDTTQAQRESIVAWFDAYEDALYGSDWRRPDLGFRRFVDVDSFIDHWIIVNLCRSVDGLQLSTFMYRPSTYGKLHLDPVWDFDRAIESYDGRDDSVSGMWGQQFLWFPRFFSDPEFAQQVADRWQELRRGVLSTVNMHALIDSMAAEITAPVAAANFARWPSNNTPRSGGWPAEIDHMKSWLAARAAWIDDQYLSPPELTPSGGTFAESVRLTMRAAGGGEIYYTLDGSDPRLPDLPGFGLELLAEAVPARGFVPTNANGGPQLGEAWKGGQEPFDDSSWLAGGTGLGFGYPKLTGIDASSMLNVSGSAYLRVPFTVEAPTLDSLGGLTLNMKYEDGFVAWINGVEVTSSNRPAALLWDSTATASHRDVFAVEFVPFDISQHLGALRVGENFLAIQVLNSTIDSADALAMPQLLGLTGSTGGPSPSAQSYGGPLQLESATTVTARLLRNGSWSGPITASYLIGTVPAGAANLAISEIMYRPFDASSSEELVGFSDRDEFEFLELMNISESQTIDLTGVRLGQVDLGGDLQGIDFTFAPDGPITFLRPGELVVLVENVEAFRRRYGPGPRIAGQYHNALSNDGERLTLRDASGSPIREFSYNDQLPWPASADGDGYSLVLVAPRSDPDHGAPLNWRPSVAVHGTPGGDDRVGFVGAPNVDCDHDGLDALAEFVLGSSDHDASSGPDRVGIERVGGEVRLAARLDLTVKDVRVSAEFSTDLESWMEDPGDQSLVELVARSHNGDGTESLSWRLAASDFRGFLRLKFRR